MTDDPAMSQQVPDQIKGEKMIKVIILKQIVS
jgi:hypothetical protein